MEIYRKLKLSAEYHGFQFYLQKAKSARSASGNFVYIPKVTDAYGNDCIKLGFRNEKKILIVKTMKYLPNEQKCTALGEDMMKWITSLVPNVVESIELEDDSTVKLKTQTRSADFPLTLMRSFFQGQGWYYKHGFRGSAEDEERASTSMNRLKTMAFSNFYDLLANITSPFVPDQQGKDPKLAFPPTLHQTHDEFTTNVEMYATSISPDIAPHHVRTFLTHMSTSPFTQKKRFELIKSAIELLGHFESQKESTKSVQHVLAPKGVRELFRHGFADSDMADDALNYIECVTNVLILLKDLTLLHTPYNLSFSKTLKN